MDTIATVEIAMQLNPNAQLRVEGDLEVSLDCPVCRRIHRTVVFSAATPDLQNTDGHRVRRMPAPESQRLLSALSGTPCDVLAERARQGRPVCTLQKFRNSQGLTYFDIEVVLNALTCDRVPFELRDTGRPIRPRRD